MATSGTQAIDRAAELLSLVVLADEPRAFGDLVSDTGLAKSTASRLLQALERHRLAYKSDEGYEAGPLFALYASRHEPDNELIWLAQPTLEALSRATGETVNLAIVRHNAVVQIAQIDSTFLLGTTNWVDVDVPSHCSALGKVFYAYGALPVPSGPLEPLAPRTRSAAAGLGLADVTAKGYATAVEELEPGLWAVAAPVRDASGGVVAALSISGPTVRLGRGLLARYGRLLVTEGRAVSALLGHDDRKRGAA